MRDNPEIDRGYNEPSGDRRKAMPITARSFRAGVLLLLVLYSVAPSTHSAENYQLETVAGGLDHPWSMTQLPSGEFLVTERRGRLLHINADGETRAVRGVPQTYVAGQGGFFDIVLHPAFPKNGLVYLSYADGSAAANSTAVFRARLQGGVLVDGRQILRVSPRKDTAQHYGGRLAFLPDGTLLLTTGEGFDYRESAQSLSSEMGKVLRINEDGRVPADNPFQDPGSERIWSYGHRNPQGLVVDADTGTVYLHEHGPRGGDELNIIQPAGNYGWPAITYGMDYSGAYVSPFTEAPDMQQPDWLWTPSIAPSGMALYRGDHFPQWRDDLFVGALVNREVRRLVMRNGKVIAEHALFGEVNARVRDVRFAPDGYLYLLTDSDDGRLIRVIPRE